MQIGNTVLYDKGQKEGQLVTVVGTNATIMTASGPITWPMIDVKEAPVKVINLSDTVQVSEELEIAQHPAEPAPAPVDDSDAASHAEDLAAEAAQQEAFQQAPRPVEPPARPRPPGSPAPGGFLDGFAPPTAPPLEDKLPFGTAIGDQGSPEPPPAANIAIEQLNLPRRFGHKWLAEQDEAFLRALLERKDLTKARCERIREELERRGKA